MKKYAVEARRVEILEATCKVVIDRGFAGTRIADVAKRLNVSNSLIHYHFDSKEALLAAAFEYYARKDLSEMERDIELGQSATAQLWRLIESYVPEGSDDVEWMLWIDAWGEALRNPLMKSISQQLDEQSIDFLERVLRRGNETGEFRCDQPRISAMRLTALIDGLAVQFAAHEGVVKRKELMRTLRTMAAFETGVSPDDIRDGRRTPRPASTRPPTDANAPQPLGTTPTAITDAALRQLLAVIADAQLRGDTTSWLNSWSPQGELTGPDGVTFKGVEALTDVFSKQYGSDRWTLQSPEVVVFLADESTGTAIGRVTVTERFQRRNGAIGSRIATLHDRYERGPQGWLLSSRRYEVLD
nr:TetR family transcriptional regulator C-terminal domain-containing protein [Acidobacteriota bacterium]